MKLRVKMVSHNEKGMYYKFNCIHPDVEATIGNPIGSGCSSCNLKVHSVGRISVLSRSSSLGSDPDG